MPITYTPGTVYEYDMILSLKQSGINAQLLDLYNTPDTNSDDPDQTLISHTLKLGFEVYTDDDGTQKTDAAGLIADIECPNIDINAVSDLYKSRAVQLSIKIKTGTLTYYSHGVLKSRKADGWTFKWDANLGLSNIQDIEEEITHPKAKEAVKKVMGNLKDKHGIPEEDFLPSSIMCLFESTTLTNTFKLYDENGKDLTTDSIVEAFITHISVSFKDTAKYPWVLGYGIAVKEIKDPKPGSPLFLPTRFWLSTTSAKAKDGSWVDPDDATLNFCMINGDVHDERKVDPAQNWYAGILAEPFRVTTKATNLHTDGVLAMSSGMFFNHWIKPVILDYFDVNNSFGMSMPTRTTIEGGTGGRSSSKHQDFDSWGWHVGPPYHDPASTNHGTLKCDVQYTSTLLDGGYLGTDTLRRIVLNLNGSISGTLTGFVPGEMALSLAITPGSSGDWAFEKLKWDIDSKSFGAYGDGAYNTGQAIWGAVSSVGTVYIMPNGDLFDFIGLDCDDEGSLYSHIKYKV